MDNLSNLSREDILTLIGFASSNNSNALSDFLRAFCERSPNVSFCSLWRFVDGESTISLVEWPRFGYCPAIRSGSTGIAGPVADAGSKTIRKIISSDEFRAYRPYYGSLTASADFDNVHSEQIVKELQLDGFVCLPIKTIHQENSVHRMPQFFAMFYISKIYSHKAIPRIDLDFLSQCLSSILFNISAARKSKVTKALTEFLTYQNHASTIELLEYLRKAVFNCCAANQISMRSVRDEKLNITNVGDKSLSLDAHTARHIWNMAKNFSKAELVEFKSVTENSIPGRALVWQQPSESIGDRSVFIFQGKVTDIPSSIRFSDVESDSQFLDRFNFEDCDLLSEIGLHIVAFTGTQREQLRRDNNSRIIAHEASQPFFDIQSVLARHKRYPKHYPWPQTLDRIEDAARLGQAMVEMNTEFTDGKLSRLKPFTRQSYNALDELEKLKKSLRRICDDARFRNDNVEIRLEPSCRDLDLNLQVLSTIFINTVTNSIKYSNYSSDDSWCIFGIENYNYNLGISVGLTPPKNLDERNGIIITTTDNGIGIPDQYKSQIFDQEFRVDLSTSGRGLGLGLWHVKRVVVALGGDIWVHSGSDFKESDPIKTRISIFFPYKAEDTDVRRS